jgi:hypothetical protein
VIVTGQRGGDRVSSGIMKVKGVVQSVGSWSIFKDGDA